MQAKALPGRKDDDLYWRPTRPTGPAALARATTDVRARHRFHTPRRPCGHPDR